ncbi:MAG: hypothetical protein AB1668_01490 [Nanoarchaeota archaeon]
MAVGKKIANKVMAYSFTVGLVVALVLGLVSAWLQPNVVALLTSVLILAGIVVGFSNISPTETKDYILFVTALVIVVSLGGDVLSKVQLVGAYLEGVLRMILAFILPSVIVVGLKAILNLAKD